MSRTLYLLLSLYLLVGCGQTSNKADGEVLFQDAFVAGETGSWLIEGDEAGRAAVISEQLFIEVDAPQTIHYVSLEDPTFADFNLTVDATQLGGDLLSSYGIMFRMPQPGQFYRFDITGNGMFMVERRNADGSWTRFVEDWQESDAVLQGLHQTNQLQVSAVGSRLSFSVNGVLLIEATDASYASGNVALDAGTFGRPGLQVVFDNVRVTSLQP